MRSRIFLVSWLLMQLFVTLDLITTIIGLELIPYTYETNVVSAAFISVGNSGYVITFIYQAMLVFFTLLLVPKISATFLKLLCKIEFNDRDFAISYMTIASIQVVISTLAIINNLKIIII